MNALPGQEAKSNVSVRNVSRTLATHDGSRKDGDDFRGAVARGDLIRGCECEVLHGGGQELQPPSMVPRISRNRGPRRVKRSDGRTAAMTNGPTACRIEGLKA